MRRIGLGFAVLLGAAVPAFAVPQVNVSSLGDPTATAGSSAGTAAGYQVLLVNLSATGPGEVIMSVDFGGGSAADPVAGPGFFGSLLQRTAVDSEGERTPTVFSATRNNSTSANSFDTHFLDVPRVPIFAVENNSNTTPGGPPADTASSDFGLGSFIQATFGLTDALQNFDLLYLVVPDGSTTTYRGTVSTSAGTFPISGTIPVPEPTAGVALAAGALLALRRRKCR